MAVRKWRHIVVAIRTPEARQQPALRKAARLAARSGAKLTLLHTFSMPYPLPPAVLKDNPDVLKLAANRLRKDLERLVTPLRRAKVKVACRVNWDFPPHEAIIRFVTRHKPDLLVADSPRHSRVGRWFLANTDWELIRECPCPVWFVKHPRLSSRPRILVAVDPTHARAKPSRMDERLVGMAKNVVDQIGGAIVSLIHAENAMLKPPNRFMANVLLAPEVMAAARQEQGAARVAMHALVQKFGLQNTMEVVRPGMPAAVIVEAVQASRAELLVMGGVSRRGLQRALIGTTAEQVIDHVGVDILIVKPAGFSTSVPRQASNRGVVLL